MKKSLGEETAALRQKLSGIIKTLDSAEEKRSVVNELFNYANFIDSHRRMTPRVALVYWACAYHLFDYLRRVRPPRSKTDTLVMPDEVRRAVKQLLTRLYTDYEQGER